MYFMTLLGFGWIDSDSDIQLGAAKVIKNILIFYQFMKVLMDQNVVVIGVVVISEIHLFAFIFPES